MSEAVELVAAGRAEAGTAEPGEEGGASTGGAARGTYNSLIRMSRYEITSVVPCTWSPM